MKGCVKGRAEEAGEAGAFACEGGGMMAISGWQSRRISSRSCSRRRPCCREVWRNRRRNWWGLGQPGEGVALPTSALQYRPHARARRRVSGWGRWLRKRWYRRAHTHAHTRTRTRTRTHARARAHTHTHTQVGEWVAGFYQAVDDAAAAHGVRKAETHAHAHRSQGLRKSARSLVTDILITKAVTYAPL